MNRYEALEQIKARRSRAEYQARLRRSSLIEGDAVCSKLVYERTRLNQEVFNRLGDPGAMAEFRKNYLDLGQKIEARLSVLLKEQGLEPDFLLPAYTCPICEDTGTRPDGSACACLCSLMLEGRPMGVNGDVSFAAFDPSVIPAGEQRENTLRLKEVLSSYAAGFTRHSENILLRGATGLGKSFLMGCTARAINEGGFSVMYLSAYEMLERFRQKHFTGEDTITPMMTVDFLIIDDLGTEPMLNNVTIEYLFAVLNSRSRDRLPYAVVTNLTPDDLTKRYGERVFSRLVDRAKLLSLSGQDLRVWAHKRGTQEGK